MRCNYCERPAGFKGMNYRREMVEVCRRHLERLNPAYIRVRIGGGKEAHGR